MKTPPEILRALTTSSLVAVEYCSSKTSGSGECELFNSLWKTLLDGVEVAVVDMADMVFNEAVRVATLKVEHFNRNHAQKVFDRAFT